MSFTIAIAGKGGAGKTTIAGLLINSLRKIGGPILAVDADPNSNLNVLLGLMFEQTIADIREETKISNKPTGISKIDSLAQRLEEILVEGEEVDLLVMGRPEGPGCYCAVNNLLRMFLSKISENYRFVVIDNEAGMEHLSRRTTDDVDVLFLVCENTKVSLNAAIRAKEITQKIPLKIKRIFLILNKLGVDLSVDFKKSLIESEIEIAGEIPFDEKISKMESLNNSILSLEDNSEAMGAINKIIERVEIF